MDTTHRSWDALSLREKSEMMKVAVQNGIYSLDDIRNAYNEYAEGGDTNDGIPRPVTTGGAGYIPPVATNVQQVVDKAKNLGRYTVGYIKNKFGFPTPYIIDLSNEDVVQVTPDTDESQLQTILTNDFVENETNGYRLAKDFKNTNDTIVGDRYRIPLSKISTYYGVEDGKLKVGALDTFNDSTVIAPNRANYVGRIKEFHEGDRKAIREYSDALLDDLEKYNEEHGYKPSWKERIFKTKYPLSFGIAHPWPVLTSYVGYDEASRIRKELGEKHSDLVERARPWVVTENNDTIRGKAFNGAPKILFGNEKGEGLFVSDTEANLDSLNNWLSQHPSYPVMVDNGRYSDFQLSNPSLDSYAGVGEKDNLFVIGTKKKALGGPLVELANKYDGETMSTQQMNVPYTPFLNNTPMQAAMRQLQADYADPEKHAAYWNATHPQTTNETPVIAQPDGTFIRETRNIPLEDASMPSKTALEFTPVVGDVMFAGDVANEARQGNYGTAATMAGLALGIPFVGNKVGKAAGKYITLIRESSKLKNYPKVGKRYSESQDITSDMGPINDLLHLRLPDFTHSSLSTGHKYRAIGNREGLKDVIENGVVAPTGQFSREGKVFWNDGYLDRNYSRKGIFALSYDKNGKVMFYPGNKPNRNYVYSSNTNPIDFYDEDLVLHARIPFTSTYKEIPKTQEGIDYALKLDAINRYIEKPTHLLYNWTLKPYVGYKIWTGMSGSKNTKNSSATTAASYANQQSLGGPLVELANRYEDGGHKRYIVEESETTPIAGYDPYGNMQVAANLGDEYLDLELPDVNIGLSNYNVNERINQAQEVAGKIGAATLGTLPIAAGMITAPMTTLAGVAGGIGGDYLGGKVGSYFGKEGELWGSVLGGTIGGLAGGWLGAKYLDPALDTWLGKMNSKAVLPPKSKFKVNWDADNWFETISGRYSYTPEEAAELASHVPEYRNIEQRLFEEGKLIVDPEGNVKVVDSEMTPQEYIMRRSEAFQKMNPEHHYTGVRRGLRYIFENESRDPTTRHRYKVWTDMKSPKNVEEYAYSGFDGNTVNSKIGKLQEYLGTTSFEEAGYQKARKQELKVGEDLYKDGTISKEDLDSWTKLINEKYEKSVLDARQELEMLLKQREIDPLNGGKVFDVTYPKEAVETPIIDAENHHWAEIPFENVKRDAPDVVSHYPDDYNREMTTDIIVNAARRNGYDITHVDNVMDTGDGTMLNETIIGYNTPVKSVLGNTGSFDITSPNKWFLYRGLVPFAIGTTAATAYANQQKYGGPLVEAARGYENTIHYPSLAAL